jgi:hypothetical protein
MIRKIMQDLKKAYGFTMADAMVIVLEIRDLNQWLDFNDLKLQSFRFAARLVNGGC